MIKKQQQFPSRSRIVLRALVITLSLATPVFATSLRDDPLLKETIHLKYVKMCVDCADGDRDLLPLAVRLLSKRGEIEVDVRENTLTVTDERKNVEAIQRLVKCYDNLELTPAERKKRCS